MRSFLSVSIATVLLASSMPFVHGYDRIIAFADSYTDNGNDYRHSMSPPSPPYWKGRFSNGPTWLEQVADELGDRVKVINHGHGGATTDNAHAYSEFNGYVVPGLLQQIEQYGVNNTNPAEDLYIIYIGYNDLNAIINPDQYHIVKPFTQDDVANSVVKGIHQLMDKYQAKTFTVMTCPPFDQWPVIKPEDKERTKTLINDYNRNLGNKVKDIEGADIHVLDDHAWFEDALSHPERFGLQTDNGACIPGINQKVKVCDDPEKHFFWDDYHPEAKVHKALGEWATSKLKDRYHLD
ncbi:unnamed protein product [Absidia cylindrospora]